MKNQKKIFPFGRLPGVTVNIEGVHTTVEFEVIEIIDDSNPYPALLGLDWAFDNMPIINLKKRQMIFEDNNMRVIVPLDPSEEECYIEPDREEYCATDIDNIYQLRPKEHDFVNPTTERKLTWEHDSSCASDPEE